MRKITSLLLLCALLLTLLTGCLSGEGALLNKGKKIITDYLSDREGARLEECWADVRRTDVDKRELTDYVKGTFRVGEESYEFAVNAVTGEIYTEEQLPAFRESCVRRIEERLGLAPADCVGVCTLWMNAPAWQEERPDRPGKMTHLGQVLPVGIEDMDAYADRAITNNDIRLLVKLAYPLSLLSADRWSLESTRDWKNTEVDIYGFEGNALPTQEELDAYAADSPIAYVSLTEEKIAFHPGK